MQASIDDHLGVGRVARTPITAMGDDRPALRPYDPHHSRNLPSVDGAASSIFAAVPRRRLNRAVTAVRRSWKWLGSAAVSTVL
ncbi:hypothetical protein Ait01nite_095040 [Actinoplanes italicus]|nr:hypothetical protein Ait01nite_095040 [Actinoplanes italicus]